MRAPRAMRNGPRPAACARPVNWSCWCRSTSISKPSPLPAASTSSAHSRRRPRRCWPRPATSRPRGSCPASTCCGPTSRCRRCASAGSAPRTPRPRPSCGWAAPSGCRPARRSCWPTRFRSNRSPRCRSSRRCSTPTRIAPTTWRRSDRLAGGRVRRAGRQRRAAADAAPRCRLRHHRADGGRRASHVCRRRDGARADLRGRQGAGEPPRGPGAAPTASRRSTTTCAAASTWRCASRCSTWPRRRRNSRPPTPP